MMSVRVRAALATLLTATFLLIALLLACDMSAQSGPVQLAVMPNTLELSPSEKAIVLILASSSATDTDFSKPMPITLTSFTGTGVGHALVTGAKRQALPPSGTTSWQMEITAPESGVSPGTLYLVAEYVLGDAGGQPITRITTATLEITGRPAEAATDVLSVTLQSDIETLLDLRERKAILVLTNVGDVPVTITSVVPTLTSTKAEQLKAVAMTSTLPITLLPQLATEIPVTLTVGSSVEAGKNLLVVRVDAKWARGDLRRQGSAVVTKAFQSGVFGETAILTAVGIPALLLLPGFLMMVGFALSYRFFRRAPADAPESDLLSLKGDLALAKPKVWFWAIGFSLLVFLVYPWISGPYLTWVTGQKEAGRNLLIGYGFIDLVFLWFVAAAVGLIFGAVAVVAVPIARRLWRQWLERFTPTLTDDEETILKKLVLNGNKNFEVETRKKSGQEVYLLPERIHVPEHMWVTPRIRTQLGEAAPSDFRRSFEEVQQTIQNGGSKVALQKLREFVEDKYLILSFDHTGELKGPTLVAEADLHPSDQGRKSILNMGVYKQ
jgi:hypothetical protein